MDAANASDRSLATPAEIDFLSGGGDTGARLRALDWSAHPLGPPRGWPPQLKTLVGVMLNANQPMFAVWGAERHMVYNDAYAAVCGARHPKALGARFQDVWHDILDEVGPILERAFVGEPTHMDDIGFVLDRNGYPEEAHFSFSYTPVRDERGTVVGMFCACAEITQQVLTERRNVELLERSRTRAEELQRWFDHAPGFVALLRGPDHVFEMANPAYLRLVGRPDVVGRPVLDALPELRGQGFEGLLDTVYATGRPYVGRDVPVTLERDGASGSERIWVDFVYEPVFDATRRVTGIFVQGHDVTEQHRAMQALRESEARFRAIQDATIDGFMVFESVRDAHGAIVDFRWVHANRAAERIVGRPREAFVGRRLLEEMPGNRDEGLFDAYVRVVETGEPLTRELAYWHENVDAYVRLVAARTHDGFAVTFADLSEHRRAEQRIRASEARFRTMADGVPMPIWVNDADGRVEFVNRAYLEYFGVAHDGIVEAGWRPLVHPDDLPAYEAAYRDASARRGAFHARCRVRGPGGEWRWIESSATARFDDAGRFAGHVGTSSDVTDLIASRESLREADQRKDEFLATLAHELRGPLAPLTNALAVIGRTEPLTERGAGALRMASRQTVQLRRLVEDLLDVSRISRGSIPLRRERLSVAAVLRQAAESIAPECAARGHALSVEEPAAPAWLDADPVRTTQMLGNLLRNACKFTPDGGRIGLAAHEREDGVEFTVTDSGIGIDPESLDRIFGLFQQVDPAAAHVHGGLGIGLALVKRLAELHGGGVRAASAGRGHGATFVLRLPRAPGDG